MIKANFTVSFNHLGIMVQVIELRQILLEFCDTDFWPIDHDFEFFSTDFFSVCFLVNSMSESC